MDNQQYSDLLLNQTEDLIWMVDQELQLVYANRSYINLMKEVTGEEKKLNTPILVEGFGEGYIEKWKAYYLRALSGEGFEIEEHFYHPETKETQYGYITFSPIRDENGEVVTVACRNTDITPVIKQKDHASQLMDASLDVFCTIDEAGKFVYVSAASADHWGYPPEELTGKPFRDFIIEEDREKTDLVAAEILAGKEFKSFSNRYRKKNGDIAYNLWSARWDDEAKLMYCVARDAKEKMEQENLLRQSEKRFRALIENGADAIVILGVDGKPNYVSSTIYKLLGYTKEEALELNLFEVIHPDDREGVVSKMTEVLQSPGVPIQGYTSRTRHKDGSWRWLEAVIVNMLHDPDINGIVDNFRDVTARMEEEHRLRLLESVVTNTHDAVLITEAEPLDEPGPKIIYVNEAFTKMTGYTAEEVIGKSPRIMQGPDSDYEELRKLGEKLRRWESSEITVLNYTKAGKPFWVNFAVSPVANERGRFTHYISIQRDVTEQKKQEAEKELLSQISLSFNNEEELIPAANRLCENLYAYGKFDLIELWCPNMEQSQIKLMGHSTHHQGFYELESEETSFHKNEGLQGKVWEKGRQLLWDKKQIDKYCIRKKGASYLGLQAILGIPLTFNDELVGVLLIGTKRNPDYLKQHSSVLSRLEKFIGSEINRKRLENDLRNVFDAIPEILCLTDFEGRFLKINSAGCALLGYTTDEVLFHSLDKFTLREDKGIFDQKIKDTTKENSVFTFENRFLSKDGQVIWLSWNCNTTLEEGLVYASAKNITTEVQLRELNAQAGSLAKIGSWEVNLENNTFFWSKIVHQLHETNPDSFFPDFETAFDFYREDFRTLVHSSIEDSITSGEGFDFEAVIITTKLKEKWVRVIGNAEIVNGKAKRIYGSFQDITDKKEPELRLQSFANNLPGVAFQYYLYPDGTDALKYVTDGAEKVWGIDAESVMKDNNLIWKQIELGGELDLVKKSIMNSVETKSEWKSQWRYIMPTNELSIHAGYGSPIFLPDKTIVFNSLILDITQKFRSEELLEQASEMAKIGSWELTLVDHENDSMYWSPMTRKILEVDDSYDPSLTICYEFCEAESKVLIQKGIERLIESGTPFDLELMIQTSKGHSKWIRCIGNAEFIDGKCVRIFGCFQDIHDQKTAEIQLKTLTNNLPGVVFQYLIFPDGTDVLRSVSKGSHQLWGYSPEEVEQDINLVWNQTKAGGDYEQVKKDVIEAVTTKSKWMSRYRSVSPNGDVRILLGSGLPNFLADGTVLFNSFVLDITNEAKNEELLSDATQMAGIGSWEVNFVNNKTLWSDITHQLHETDAISFIPELEKNIDFYREDCQEMVRSHIRSCIEDGKPFDFEAVLITAKNKERWVRAIGRAEIIKGQCTRIHGSIQDIHSAKSNELRLKEILGSISDAFYAVDAEWNFTYFNREAENLLKKSADEVLGGNIWEIFYPAKGTIMEEVYRRVASTGQSENFEYHYPGDGSWYELTVYSSSGGVSSYFKNIDERRKTAQELEKAYKARNKILESIGDAFFAVDEEWTITYWNKQAETVIGKKKEYVLGKNLWEVFPDAKDTDFYRQYHRAMETGETVDFEEYYAHLEMWIEVTVYPSENGLSIYFKDITLRKTADIRLLEANERFELVTKATDDAIWDWDIENDRFYRSQNIYKFFGKEAPTTLTSKEFWNDSFHPDDLKTIKESISKALKDKQTERWEMEYRIVNEKGNTVYVVDKGLIIRDASDKAVRMIGAITDITELKRANIELTRQAEFINAITDNPLAAIVACNADGELTLFNKTAKEWHGVDAMKVTQDKWAENYDLYRKDGINLLDKSEIPLVKAINGEKVINNEIIIKKKSEKARIVLCNGSSFHDSNGEKLGAVVIMTDITERKKAERELLAINEKLSIQTKELQRSNEELEQFAFITSHDLQEPLRMISSFMDQLKRKYADQLDEKALQYIHFATDGAKRMKQIVLDLLLYSRANRPTEEFQEVNLNELVSEYTQLRRKLIAEKKATITFDELPVLETYRAPITQIIHCLLDNALRYVKENEPPRIEIHAEEKESSWEFAVQDNGIGIDEKFYQKIFIIFQRLHNRNQHEGTGVGLSIAKRSVEFLGGEIWLESTVGEGATFYFTIAKNNP